MKTYNSFVDIKHFQFVGQNIKPENYRYIGAIINFSYQSDYGYEQEFEVNVDYSSIVGFNNTVESDIDNMISDLIKRFCKRKNLKNNFFIFKLLYIFVL